MKTICFIPARGGSVRIPRKNLRQFYGRPIISYSIENAQKSGLFDEVVVSTDDDEIANVAATWGARYVRRPTCDGTQGTQELAGGYLKTRPDVGMCCVLYATAPLLTWRDIALGWQTFLHSDWSNYTHTVDLAGQDIGGFYWGFAQSFRDGRPLDPSDWVRIDYDRAIDINTEADFQRAVRMYGEQHGN